MQQHAQSVGLENAVIIHTCAVTVEAERDARQAIRRARRAQPDAKIIVTGCGAQINPDGYAAMAEVDHVLGNADKLAFGTWENLQGGFEPARVLVNDIMSMRETAEHLITEMADGQTRAFVQVQNGCDHRCTFCIIPYGRGPSRSVPVAQVVEQIRLLVNKGYQEVVLTGVDLTSYGHDLPGSPSFGQLVKRVLSLVPELPRLRLSSLDPVEMDDELFVQLGSQERLMPHLHLSLQAGDDMVLKRMKRRHLRADAIACVQRAKAMRPDIVFGADLIAGFPTETDDMHASSLSIIDECDLTYLHIFTYSPRPGTPAAKMPQVPFMVRKQRTGALREKAAQQLANKLSSFIGQTLPVLVEGNGLRGHTPHFAPVQFSILQKPGQVILEKMTNADAKSLFV